VGKYSAVQSPPKPDRERRVRDAADACPVNAIIIQ